MMLEIPDTYSWFLHGRSIGRAARGRQADSNSARLYSIPPSTMGPSTRENPPRTINWLFSNPVNVRRAVHCIDVPGHPRDPAVEALEWVAALKENFRFQAHKSTIEFWKVSYRPRHYPLAV